MRIVSDPAFRPAKCAVIPHIAGCRENGYIDTGVDMLPSPIEQRVYISRQAVHELARMYGHPAPEDMTDALDALASAQERIRELEAEVAEADKQLDAVHTLKAAGYTAQRKPGRKPKELVEA